ncbi:potassium channel family protein [Natronococcus amylolyticus]|nr:potassium channel protein [Natronococcus amylolyticus]
MARWENRPQSMIQSLEVVFQSFTTTGYGQDAPWETPQMNILVIGMQLAGVGLILAAINAVIVPWLRSAFQPSLPTDPVTLEDHVVICGVTPRTESFASEMDTRGKEYVIVESDFEIATELYEAGQTVVHGDPEVVTTLEQASVDKAAAVVVDASDDVNASIILSVREINSEVTTIAVTEDRELREYQRIAGADELLSPRQLLGESLAVRAKTATMSIVENRMEITDDLELAEISVTEESPFCNTTLADCRFHKRYGVTVVGAWDKNEFIRLPSSDFKVEETTHLLIAGTSDSVNDLQAGLRSTSHRRIPQRVLIAGYGESGAAAKKALSEEDMAVTVLDTEDKSGVDIVGDARQPDVLQEAGIEDVSAVIVTVSNDTTAIFTTLIASDMNPDAEIIVRAIEEENTTKLYRAGAATVEALATISGQMIATTIFDDSPLTSFKAQILTASVTSDYLSGKTVAEAERKTDMNPLIIIRNGNAIFEFDPDSFILETGDMIVGKG